MLSGVGDADSLENLREKARKILDGKLERRPARSLRGDSIAIPLRAEPHNDADESPLPVSRCLQTRSPTARILSFDRILVCGKDLGELKLDELIVEVTVGMVARQCTASPFDLTFRNVVSNEIEYQKSSDKMAATSLLFTSEILGRTGPRTSA